MSMKSNTPENKNEKKKVVKPTSISSIPSQQPTKRRQERVDEKYLSLFFFSLKINIF